MKIGSYVIPKAVVLAPMEDVTDISFRLVCKRMGADIVYTEFVNAEGLVRDSAKTRQKMLFMDEERPFGIQIYGGNENSMERAARMAEELQPDLIDINCGCWVRKVVGQGAGAGLLRDLAKMQRVVTKVVKAVSLPVTVKTRLGWDAESINIVDVAKMVEDAGAAALTIHCRTRVQGQKGSPDYAWIPKVKSAVFIPTIVNGGIDSPQAAKHVFDTTGCDGVMVGRATIGNPWIFREIKTYLATGVAPESAKIDERILVLVRHLTRCIQAKGERRGVVEFRKYYSGYLRHAPGVSSLRAALMDCTEVGPVLDLLVGYLENYANQYYRKVSPRKSSFGQVTVN